MNKLIRYTAAFCSVVSVLFASCDSPKQVSSTTLSYKHAHDPKFIDNIAVGANKNTIGMNGIVKEKLNPNINPAETNTLQEKYATILGVRPRLITNYSLYAFIDDWYGVDYRLGGNDKTGIDCSAFVQRLYEEVFGVNLVRTAIEQFGNCSLLTNKDEIKEGDLVFFHIHSRHITHVGIYLMNSFFVHASASQGVMISSLNESYWQRYFAGAGEIPMANKG